MSLPRMADCLFRR